MRTLPASLAAAALALAACNRAPPPAAPKPPAPTPAVAKKPPPPPVLAGLLASAVAVEPDGKEISLLSDDAPLVHPGSSFRLVFQRRLPDLRLSLLDGDAMIPAEGSREVTDATTVKLKPTSALQPEVSYQLRADGAATREAHDEEGNTFQPFSVLVRTSGVPAPEEKPARKKKG